MATMIRKLKIKIALLGCLSPLLFASASRGQTYKAVGEYKLSGSNARGIAVDAKNRRIYVAGDEGVAVLNADTGANVGTVPFPGARDVLLIPVMTGEEQGAPVKGFATGDGSVISFALADLKPSHAQKLPTAGPSSLCYDDDSKTVEVVSEGGSLTTIDAGSNEIVHSAHLPTGSGQIACGTLGHVYVADTAANVVHVLNHETSKSEGDYPMMTGHKPSGLALDTKGRRLFVACEDSVVEIIDTDSGFTFIELPGGAGPARETFAWTPQGKGKWKAAAFISQEDGTLTGVKMNAYINYSVGGTYKLGPGLGSVAYDSATHHLFLTAVRSGTPVVVVASY
ncbi:MAG TPA: hypothetical protein VGM27_23560 [Acidobacteriaceae bacterium]